MGNEEEARFFASLTNEKLKSQERRGALASRKLGWITGLFALGAVKLPLEIESQVLLYLVPVVALVFDLYILGENFGIKRMGAFVKEFHPNCPEAQWERWLAGRRDRFSWYALPLSTIVITLGSTFLLCAHGNNWVLGSWLAFVSSVGFGIYLYANKVLKELDTVGHSQNT
jgi:drug/metabolite transporter (DMT)-like permease